MGKINSNMCKELFGHDYLKASHEELVKLDELADRIMSDNSWDEVYACFDKYLRENCKTEDDVINYVLIFIRYTGLEFRIPSQYDPYDLVGYVYSMVDLEKRWDDCGGEFDDFANQALKINLYHDPYYQFWRDPKIIAIAEKYKKERNESNKNDKGNDSKAI